MKSRPSLLRPAIFVLLCANLAQAANPPLGREADPRPKGEDDQITRIVDMAVEKVKKDYPAGTLARRDAHPKAHGCVVGEFKVESKLLPDFVGEKGLGIFTPGDSFPAIIRYSNGNPKDQADKEGDGRGMAVKLINAARGRPTALNDAKETSQDFIMINHPRFFLDGVSEYVGFNAAANGLTLGGLKLYLAHHWFIFGRILELASEKVTNPLQAKYYSMVPYQLGPDSAPIAVKYAAFPVACANSVLAAPTPKSDRRDFLREALRESLDPQVGKASCFEFLVQKQTDADTMPVEKASVRWDESASPFKKVATLTIRPQSFEQNQRACENLSYNPWHALAVHKPLGGLNRTRKAVYEAVSRTRHQLNQEVQAEPTTLENFPPAP